MYCKKRGMLHSPEHFVLLHYIKYKRTRLGTRGGFQFLGKTLKSVFHYNDINSCEIYWHLSFWKLIIMNNLGLLMSM